MKYNLYIKTQLSTYNILDISDEDLKKVVDTFKYGEESFLLNGKTYFLNRFLEIKIYSFEHPKIKTGKQLLECCKQNSLFTMGIPNKYISGEILEQLGTDKTNEFIKRGFGYLKDKRIDDNNKDPYVALTRIDELSNIRNSKYDFTKLTSILEELNVVYANNCIWSIPLLVRTIMDHIPPVFGKEKFSEVCNNYPGSKSFKARMKNLEDNRKIADGYLHTQIRDKESLPAPPQIDFRANLDALLEEIVRINKENNKYT